MWGLKHFNKDLNTVTYLVYSWLTLLTKHSPSLWRHVWLTQSVLQFFLQSGPQNFSSQALMKFRRCIWYMTLKKNGNFIPFSIDGNYILLLHKKPRYPSEQPFKHVPLIWWQCWLLEQEPQLWLQSIPYIPPSHSENISIFANL
jgi:hypothetical protein